MIMSSGLDHKLTPLNSEKKINFINFMFFYIFFKILENTRDVTPHLGVYKKKSVDHVLKGHESVELLEK